MRFQPTIVPRPSAIATATLTQVGMNLVPRSSAFWKLPQRRLFVGAEAGGSQRADFFASRTASLARYMSLRTFCTTAAGTLRMVPLFCTCARDVRGQGRDAGVDRGVGEVRGADRVGHARLAGGRVHRDAAGMGGEHVVRTLHRGHEGWRLAVRHRAVQRVGGRQRADEDQHDEAHALLAVIGAVEERHQAAGQDQQAANPGWRRLGGVGRRIQFASCARTPSSAPAARPTARSRRSG